MFCEQCGTKNDNLAKFCSSCGTAIAEAGFSARGFEASSDEELGKKSNKTLITWFWISSCVLFALGVFLFYKPSQPSDANPQNSTQSTRAEESVSRSEARTSPVDSSSPTPLYTRPPRLPLNISRLNSISLRIPECLGVFLAQNSVFEAYPNVLEPFSVETLGQLQRMGGYIALVSGSDDSKRSDKYSENESYEIRNTIQSSAKKTKSLYLEGMTDIAKRQKTNASMTALAAAISCEELVRSKEVISIMLWMNEYPEPF